MSEVESFNSRRGYSVASLIRWPWFGRERKTHVAMHRLGGRTFRCAIAPQCPLSHEGARPAFPVDHLAVTRRVSLVVLLACACFTAAGCGRHPSAGDRRTREPLTSTAPIPGAPGVPVWL